MTERWALLRRAPLVASLALSACAQDEQTIEAAQPLGTTSQAIVAGQPEPSAEFTAVGALVWTFPDFGVVHVFCSATLIAPQTIVTARHCTPSIDEAVLAGVTAEFAIGPDAYNPIATVPITGYVNAPPAPGLNSGLLLDGGRDVAVAYLAAAPADVTPVQLGLWENDLLGERFTIAGYGWTEQGALGQRYSGEVTARAIHGRWYPLLFNNDYDAYLDWYFSDSAAAAGTAEEAKEWWKIYRLENKYELLAGGLPGEAIGCFGDSGGPLLQGDRADNLTTYGVSFATEATISTLCGLGGGYLVFNRQMLDFVEGAL